MNTKFYPGRQLFYLYSCQNIHYWKEPIRDLFPSVNQKFVFGTKENGWWGTSPAAVFVTSIVKREKDSAVVVKALNDIKDCPNDCFTSY